MKEVKSEVASLSRYSKYKLIVLSLVPILTYVGATYIKGDSFGFKYYLNILITFYSIYVYVELIIKEYYKNIGSIYPILAMFVLFCISVPIFFSNIYDLIERSTPCINGINGVYDSLYFSYTTLTTLGYGDLQPIGYCRFVTSIESILGYIFLGILVAALSNLLRDQSLDMLDKRIKKVVEDMETKK